MTAAPAPTAPLDRAPVAAVGVPAAPAVEGPVIVAARLGPGHDGRAEVVVELAHPNGARTTLSIGQEATVRALDAAGLAHLDDLAGQPWTVLVAGSDLLAGAP